MWIWAVVNQIYRVQPEGRKVTPRGYKLDGYRSRTMAAASKAPFGKQPRQRACVQWTLKSGQLEHHLLVSVSDANKVLDQCLDKQHWRKGLHHTLSTLVAFFSLPLQYIIASQIQIDHATSNGQTWQLISKRIIFTKPCHRPTVPRAYFERSWYVAMVFMRNLHPVEAQAWNICLDSLYVATLGRGSRAVMN